MSIYAPDYSKVPSVRGFSRKSVARGLLIPCDSFLNRETNQSFRSLSVYLLMEPDKSGLDPEIFLPLPVGLVAASGEGQTG